MKEFTAQDILKLLMVKHADCVCVPECKNGPSYANGLRKIDLWVMPKSWAKPAVTAYEIKVDRSDFLRDDKWTDYMDYCNVFYFVCPWRLIEPQELPPEAGLIWAPQNEGVSRLLTKKKAPVRDITIPQSIFRYILMSRAKIDAPKSSETTEAEKWRNWLERKKENQRIGWDVRGRIRDIAQRIEEENRRLKQRIEDFERIREFLIELGVSEDTLASGWLYHEAMRLLHEKNEIPRDAALSIRRAISSLQDIPGVRET